LAGRDTGKEPSAANARKPIVISQSSKRRISNFLGAFKGYSGVLPLSPSLDFIRHSQAFRPQVAVAREFEEKVAAIQQPSPVAIRQAIGLSCSATPTLLSPADDCTCHAANPLPDASSASPQLAAAFGLVCASRDAAPRSSPRQRTQSVESPMLPTLVVIFVMFMLQCVNP
jgi:hypothetical protein